MTCQGDGKVRKDGSGGGWARGPELGRSGTVKVETDTHDPSLSDYEWRKTTGDLMSFFLEMSREREWIFLVEQIRHTVKIIIPNNGERVPSFDSECMVPHGFR